jgi:penicillin G amidase
MPDFKQKAHDALAQLAGTIEFPDRLQPVEILRDRWGIAHIYAGTTRDLFFAQGFVAAQDRLWQMEMWRRAGEGRLAEILGPGAL